MRPLRLSVDGMACFKDEQEIDFRPLELFAISGSTGAGKSTILDAILFALYGTVPRMRRERIGEIVSVARDRMSVVFEFALGSNRYRIARTARRKGGAASVRIDQHDGTDYNLNLADQVRPAKDKIIDLVGLDDSAFTQAVILPQGEFARFLTSDPRDRRAMLRTLLRLQIYEEMRKEANGIASAKAAICKTKRERLEEDYIGVNERALEETRIALTQITDDVEALKGQRQHGEQDLDVLRALRGKTAELEKQTALRAQLVAEQGTIDAATAEIEAAGRAAKVVPAIDYACKARDQLERAHKGLAIAETACQTAQAAHTRAKTALDDATQEAGQIPAHRLRVEQLARVIGRLTERDAARQTACDLERQLADQQQQVATARAALGATHKEQREQSTSLERSKEALSTVSYDADLDQTLEAVRDRATRLGEQRKSLAQLAAAIEQRQQQLADLARQHATAAELAKGASAAEVAAAEAFAAVAYDGDLDAALDRIRDQATALRTARQQLAEMTRAQEAQESCLIAARGRLETAKDTAARRQAAREQAQARYDAATEALHAAERADAANHLRTSLVAGQSCPVCEQTVERPPAANLCPETAERKAAVEQAKRERDEAVSAVEDAASSVTREETKVAAAEQTLTETAAALHSQHQNIDQVTTAILDGLGSHAPVERDRPIEAWVDEARQRNAAVKSEHKRCEQQLHVLRQTANELTGKAESLARDVAAAEKALGEAQEGHGQLEQGIVADESFITEHLGRVLPEDETRSVEQWVLHTVARLAEERRGFEKARSAVREAEQERDRLATAVQLQTERQGHLEATAVDLQERLELAQSRLAEIEGEIAVVTTATDPEAERAAVAADIEAIERRLGQRTTEEATCRRDLAGHEGTLEERRRAVREAEAALGTATAQMEAVLAKAGFSSAEAAAAAARDEEALACLEERVVSHDRQLHTVEHQIAALERDLEGRRVEPAELEAAEAAHRAIRVAHEGRIAEQAKLQQRNERLAQRLAKATELRAVLKEEESAHRIHKKLAMDLMSDRFQAFMLEEAFTELVRGASVRLHDLTGERYSLEFKADQIVVIDHDNAGETRISATLSGGETFLTSLALALELSDQVQRAAGAVNLDSLFIDEGFGTLDPETLAVVAETIQNLQVGGRMVGIITHIPELRDEFSQQILVEKRAEGSVIRVRSDASA